jgi:lipid-binding SYLF domain-containing protein
MVATLLSLALAATLPARAQDDLQAKAEQAVSNFKSADPTLTNFFAKSAGYVILPTVAEGGFVVGAEHGKGFLYEKGKITGKVSLTEMSVGAQVGGGTFSELVFLETAAAVQTLKDGKCEMDAQAKAVVAASGAAASAKFQQGVAVFALPKTEAMIKAVIGGQKFKFEALSPAK